MTDRDHTEVDIVATAETDPLVERLNEKMVDREHKPIRWLPKGITKGSMRLRRADGRTYLARRRISTPWFRVLLHKMEAPDPGTHLHDHPWPFRSLILWGGYTETRCDTREASLAAMQHEYGGANCGYGVPKRHGFLSVNNMPLNVAHRITDLNKKTCWTLVLAGKRVREWGFYPPQGWVHHMHYDSKAFRGDLKTEGVDPDG